MFFICENIGDFQGAIYTYRKFSSWLPKEKLTPENEKLKYSYARALIEIKEYDEAGDYELYEGELENLFYLNSKKFIVLYPGEPHMALIKGGEKPAKVRKVIFKVLVD